MRILIIRYGAAGDQVMITPLLRALKQDGHHITLNVSEYGYQIIKRNPNVDKFIIHKTDSIKNEDLDKHWEELGKGYDKVINLSESIEGALLKVQGRPEFLWSKEKRHAECDVNYFDRTMELGGYPERKGELPELHFSPDEIATARQYRKKYKDKFLILWSLSGSSHHKVYPYSEHVAKAILDKLPDSMILFTGDTFCQLLELEHPRAKHYSGVWPIRKAMLMTKYVDLVIGTETGVLNASACYDTPKIVMMSHSSNENLIKYWKNVTPIRAVVDCTPCHRLIYTLDGCPVDSLLKSPICMAKIPPAVLLNAAAEQYGKWYEERNAHKRRL